jgi:hypothetical protein
MEHTIFLCQDQRFIDYKLKEIYVHRYVSKEVIMDENQTLKQELQDAYLVIAYLQNEKIASDDCGCGGDCICHEAN